MEIRERDEIKDKMRKRRVRSIVQRVSVANVSNTEQIIPNRQLMQE
jgi:hypothetical protein